MRSRGSRYALRNLKTINVEAYSKKLKGRMDWTVINWAMGVVRHVQGLESLCLAKRNMELLQDMHQMIV
jgi:hypothetical protein